MINGSNVNANNKKAQLNDKDILDFYNLATGRLLTGLEVSIQLYLAKKLEGRIKNRNTVSLVLIKTFVFLL